MPSRVPSAWSQHSGEVAFVGWLVFGEAHIVVDAKDGVFGSQIAQGLDGIEAEDQAQDEVLEDSLLSHLFCSDFRLFLTITASG